MIQPFPTLENQVARGQTAYGSMKNDDAPGPVAAVRGSADGEKCARCGHSKEAHGGMACGACAAGQRVDTSHAFEAKNFDTFQSAGGYTGVIEKGGLPTKIYFCDGESSFKSYIDSVVSQNPKYHGATAELHKGDQKLKSWTIY